MHNDNQMLQNEIPEIYSALNLIFGENVSENEIKERLEGIGIFDFKICKPKIGRNITFTIGTIYYERYWHLEDALNAMFFKLKDSIIDIKTIVDMYYGEIQVDIAFYHYAAFPSLVISGENMRIIRYLCASISIDPY